MSRGQSKSQHRILQNCCLVSLLCEALCESPKLKDSTRQLKVEGDRAEERSELEMLDRVEVVGVVGPTVTHGHQILIK